MNDLESAPLHRRPALGRWRLACEIALWRHGCWPLLTVLLLAGSARLWFGERIALQQRIADASRPAASARVTAPGGDGRGPLANAQRLARFRAALPPGQRAAEEVQRLVSAPRDGLSWRQAEFSYADDASIGLRRVQITVPVTGTYRQLRAALGDALRDMPHLSIDTLLLQRDSAGESGIRARIRLSVWLDNAKQDAPQRANP